MYKDALIEGHAHTPTLTVSRWIYFLRAIRFPLFMRKNIYSSGRKNRKSITPVDKKSNFLFETKKKIRVDWHRCLRRLVWTSRNLFSHKYKPRQRGCASVTHRIWTKKDCGETFFTVIFFKNQCAAVQASFEKNDEVCWRNFLKKYIVELIQLEKKAFQMKNFHSFQSGRVFRWGCWAVRHVLRCIFEKHETGWEKYIYVSKRFGKRQHHIPSFRLKTEKNSSATTAGTPGVLFTLWVWFHITLSKRHVFFFEKI